MNYILGSGLVAFIAKAIFPKYEIIPLGKSRYYQFDVATCDDYIFCHKDIDDFIDEIAPATGMKPIPVFFKRALSFSGQLIFNKNEGFLNNWVQKVYGQDANPNTITLTKFDPFVYNIAATDLFKALEKRHKLDFKKFIEQGDKYKSIDLENKIIYTSKEQIGYDNIINTMPLNALFDSCGIEHDLESKDLHTFVVETPDLDFEGASELLVADENIDFYKCTRIGKQTYQFFGIEEIMDLPTYLNLIINKFDILSATVVRKAIPIGDINQHKDLEQYGIISVGSNAQWDDMMDISSCIRRLMRIAKDTR